MLLLTAEDVRRFLDPEALDQELRAALRQLGAGLDSTPPRISALTPQGRLTAMPGYLPGTGLVLKAVAVCPDNVERDLPTHQATIVLYDEHDGTVTAIMDGTVITQTRTAACAAIGADVLARPDATSLTIVGTGHQAQAHLEMAARIRPWQRIRVVGRNAEKAAAVAASRPESLAGVDIGSSADVESAVRAADVVLLCTDALEPVIEHEWLAPGAHVSSVGRGQEAADRTMETARVFVEWTGAVEFAPPAGARELQGWPVERVTTVGAVLDGSSPGRRDDEEITLYKSTGHAAEDAAAGQVVLRNARAAGAGVSFEF